MVQPYLVLIKTGSIVYDGIVTAQNIIGSFFYI